MIAKSADAQWCRGKRCTEFPFHFENTAYAFIVAQYLPELPLWMLVTFPLLGILGGVIWKERAALSSSHVVLRRIPYWESMVRSREVIVRRASAFGLRVFLYPGESAMLITEPRAPSSVLAHFMGFADLDRFWPDLQPFTPKLAFSAQWQETCQSSSKHRSQDKISE